MQLNRALFLLTENNENDVRLHRVVHEASILFCKGRRNEDHYNSKSEILNRAQNAAKALYYFKNRDDNNKILPHLKSFNAVTELFFQQDLPASIGSVLQKRETAEAYLFFGGVLRQSYQFQPALQFLNVSLMIWKDSDENLSNVYSELADTHYDLGEYSKSKDYHQRAGKIRKNLLGVNHIKVATSYNNLGEMHRAVGELEQAKDYHQRVMEIKKTVLDPNHMNVVLSYNNLGEVHRDIGELEQAKDYPERAMRIKKSVFGPNHIELATSYNNLGLVHEDMGELEQAKVYHQRAI